MIEDHDEDPAGSERSSAPARSLPLRAMTWVLAGLAVLGLIAVVAEAAWLRPRYGDLREAERDRQEVLATTQQWALLLNTHTPQTFDEQSERLLPLLTTKARTAYEREIEAARPLIEALEQESEGTVLKQGIASIDDDSAVVLTVVDAERRNSRGTFQRHFRFEVDLAEVDGEWLVDDFTPVQSGTAEVTP